MLRALLVVIVVLALLAAGPLRGRLFGSKPAEVETRVVAVLDGDTVIVRTPAGEDRVRLIGIDTPEIAHDGNPQQCYSLRATRFVRRRVLGRSVELTPGREQRDRYGRLLAYVRRPGERGDLEEQLLRGGFARTLEIAPNLDRAARYRMIESEARVAKRGLWGSCIAERT